MSKENLKLRLSGLILVLLASFIVLGGGLGHYPLFNPDEALYAEPAREMLVTGEYVTTLLNYVVRYTKPPLCIWAMALCFKLFGVNEMAARLFGVGCGTILVAVVYLFIARYISVRAAVIGALSLVFAPLFVLTAREAITDMPLALFMAGSQLAFFHAFKRRSFPFAMIAYLLLGLAVMTKGPVGLVLPLGILFVYHFLRGELKVALQFYKPLIGALFVGLISLPWFILEISVTKGAYFQEFIVRENFQRFTAVVDNHKQPFWYHGAAMFAGYFPFSFYLPQILFVQAKRLVTLLRANFSRTEARSNPGENAGASVFSILAKIRSLLLVQSPAEDLYFYCLLWALSVLIFYSMSVSKLLPYTLPAFPAMAILVAGELEAAFVTSSFTRLGYPLLAMVIVYAGAGALGPQLMRRAKSLPAGIPALLRSFAAMQTGAAFLALVLLRLRRNVIALTAFALISAGVFAVYLNLALPLIAAKLEGPLPQYARVAGQAEGEIIVFDMRKPGVPFYALRRVENINGGDELKAHLAAVPVASILSKIDKLEFLKTLPSVTLTSQEGDYCLLQHRAR
ncbi:MAG: glycosyltransferase family 39 protein [Cyanobacteria bacterium REEB67]|nr:glycosyltransferase family 39 protein [Cyanobacteria bacterium REEB67]